MKNEISYKKINPLSTEIFYNLLRCPITGVELKYQSLVNEIDVSNYNELKYNYGLLWANENIVYPVIDYIPRLLPEAMLDYESFLSEYISDFSDLKKSLPIEHFNFIQKCHHKNKRTKESFFLEWNHFQYGNDKTWDADQDYMLTRFLKETDETTSSLKDKFIFDVGCGNGLLDEYLGNSGAYVMAMDLSRSIENAFKAVSSHNVFFIQGDLQYPPIAKYSFDIVQCSGVLIHTDNTKKSFLTIEQTVKKGGKLSVWLYHHRKDFIHNLFNSLRNVSSKFPLKIQYYVYALTIFPLSYVIKKLKGNTQNRREMMIDILDWLTPQYRWEHTHEETYEWFKQSGYIDIKFTTNELFGFNTTGTKK